VRERDQPDVAIDSIDLYEERPAGYRNFLCCDLEEGVPDELGSYDMIVSCEGIEHIANPGLFLKSAREHLNPGGVIVITTPNTWYPGAHGRTSARARKSSLRSGISDMRTGDGRWGRIQPSPAEM
jgi:2-polyprenyl-3-methyl-5-hydroxy-6-metoxy-1,4-benzoquinol methylase